MPSYQDLSPELRALSERLPDPITWQDLSPELRALSERLPDPITWQDLSPELRALIESQPGFNPADYATPAAPRSSDDPDSLFAFLEGRRTVPRGYRGRPIAVVRGIHPRNILIYLITWVTVFGGCILISLLYNTFFAR